MANDMPDSSDFLRAIALTEVDPRLFDRAFTAVPQYVPWPKAYGGDPVAQAAAAAMATVTDGKMLHSLHSTFLRPINAGHEVRYEVEIIRDGRGYSSRHIRGYQTDKVVFLSTASFQSPEDGAEFQQQAPAAPEPASLPTSAEYLEAAPGDLTPEAIRYWSTGRSFDHRHVPGPLYARLEGGHEPGQAVWIKAFSELGDDPAIHQLAIAYACDYTILESSLRALGLSWASHGLTTASLDHAMWFHRPARADEWLLYAQEAVSVQSGRGLGTGRFFTRSGELIATVAQEGLIRVV
jgi:acyl-CoA thioesterase-2